MTYALVLHGGAGAHPALDYSLQSRHLADLIAQGQAMLTAGMSALETVAEMVQAMEASGLYVAGKGSAPNRDGVIELDASIMDGATRRAGAIAALRHFVPPIAVARRVLGAVGQVLRAGGERRLIFGDDDGRVSVLDASVNTWSDGNGTAAFTATWQSNWLDMGDKQSRKTINKLIVDVAKATARSTLVVTLEVRDHEDGYTRKRSATVHMTNLRTPILTQLGGRYLRIKLVHSGEGDVEIQRILAELVGTRMDKVGAR